MGWIRSVIAARSFTFLGIKLSKVALGAHIENGSFVRIADNYVFSREGQLCVIFII